MTYCQDDIPDHLVLEGRSSNLSQQLKSFGDRNKVFDSQTELESLAHISIIFESSR